MAKEILILNQTEAGRSIHFTYAILIPSTPRIVDGEVIAFTPTNTLTDYLNLLEESELQDLDDGKLIWTTNTLTMVAPLDIEKLKATMRIVYRDESVAVRKRHENAGAAIGMRFDAVERR